MTTPETAQSNRRRSLLYRLHHTPIQDALRGVWSASLDHRRAVEESTLPPVLQAIVLEVVRRARLWRRERLDVARELTAHFEDGLRCERTADALIADFGPPRTAARLIRRAKLRRRPLPFRAAYHTVRAAGWTSAVLIILYLLLVARLLLAGSPRMTRDFVAEHDAVIAKIPPEQRAWPLYREAFLRSEMGSPGISGTAIRGYRTPEWQQIRDTLARQQDVIARYREASLRPYLGAFLNSREDDQFWTAYYERWPSIKDRLPKHLASGQNVSAELPSLFDLTFGGLSVLTTAFDLIEMDLLDGLIERDTERVTADVLSLLRVAGHRGDYTLRGAGTKVWNYGESVEYISEVLTEAPELLSDRALADLALAFKEVRVNSSAMVSRLTPRDWFEALVQQCYSAGSDGNGSLVSFELMIYNWPRPQNGSWEAMAERLLPPVLSAIAVDRRTIMNKYDELERQRHALFAQPLWKVELPTEIERWAFSRWIKLRFLPIAFEEYSITRGFILHELALQKCDAARVAIALHRYRRVHGKFPMRLVQLVPQFIDEVPPDRHDGKPLKYRLRPEGPCLYSVGGDGDDDGGHPPVLPSYTRPYANEVAKEKPYRLTDSTQISYRLDGDWVLYPNVK